jgi:hypothetical protein
MQPVQVQRYGKSLRPTPPDNAAYLTSLKNELLATQETRAPPGLELSRCGLQVRVRYADANAAARTMNPGFLELGMGGPEAALAAVVGQGPPESTEVTCVVVPADSRCSSRGGASL